MFILTRQLPLPLAGGGPGEGARRSLATLAFLACLAPSLASAYCRTTTAMVPPPSSCAQACVTEGLPLDWGRACVGYAINERGSETIPFERVIAVSEASFARWTDVECTAGPIGISVIREPTLVSCDDDYFNTSGPNVNVLAFVPDWDERDYDPSAFALTQVKFRISTGAILDADLLVNEDSWTFAECPIEGCMDGRVDLENTLVHEGGHFLGLSHTPDDPAATMWACADPGETIKRSLEPDDIAGICAIFGGRELGSCDPTPIGGFSGECPSMSRGGCAIVPRGSSWSLLLVAVIAVRKRR